MHSLLKSLDSFNDHQDYVVAIIINTKGSTYRKTGAMMLVDQDLNYWGLLSGGCLEGDIILHCKNVFLAEKDKTIEYNMRDEVDMLWGMGLGCDGEITVLLKYLPASEKHYAFFTALMQLNTGTDQTLTIDKSANHQMTFGAEFSSTYQTKENIVSFKMKSPHHLLICGGAPDVTPVTAIAKQIGWKTTVIDHREDYARTDNFPQADHVKVIRRSMWKDFDLNFFDSAIIMSHQFERDQSYLSRLIKSNIGYIGLLGPTNRRNKLLEQCETDFSKQEGRVFGPVGLDIGADSPETIALAIISEIQAVINNKQSPCQSQNKINFCYQDPNR